MTDPVVAPGRDPEDVLRRLAIGLSRGSEYVLMLCDENFDIEYVSPSITATSGWDPADLVGRNVLEQVHPDDLAHAARLLEAEMQRPMPYGADVVRRTPDRLRVLAADGRWIACEYAGSNLSEDPEVRGNVFVMRDNTEQQLIDAVHEAIVSGGPLDDTAGRIARLLSGQLEGLRVRVLVDVADPVVAGHTEGDVQEVVSVTESGRGRVAADHPADRPPSEWVKILVERAAQLLEAAIVRDEHDRTIRRRLDEKTAIISAVSHDLRSPLAAIQLMSTLLDGDGGRLSEEQRRELVARIGADARRTSRLLTDLTAVDRLLHGAVALHPQPVHLGRLVAQVLSELDLDGRPTPSIAPSDAVVSVDPVLTERVVDNLVSNALKHTSAGSRVQVVIEEVDDAVLLHVDDDGPGVLPASRTRIFDAYVRGDGASAGLPGSGVGLFLVRTFTEVQGGAVGCFESPWGGARFTVRFPASTPESVGRPADVVSAP